MKLAIIGATGVVGQEMLRVLEEHQFPYSALYLAASKRSQGKQLYCKGQAHAVITIEEALAAQPDLALFSAGGETSKAWAQRFTAQGCTVIDNSSAWRMNPDVPLVVPEINFATAGPAQLIANPNCSTIQLVMALAPLQQYYGLARVIVSTYQAVSGSGKQALDQLKAERAGDDSIKAYPHPIDGNCLPHCDAFQEDGYTKEEHKLLNESRKILALPELPLSATAVRVPVMVGHAEAVNVELNAPFELSEVRNLLAQQLGVEVLDEPQQNVYPMPKTAAGRDPVYVGRLRADPSRPNCLNLWVVADNLRKGAATNAIQIAEQLAKAGRFRAASHT